MGFEAALADESDERFERQIEERSLHFAGRLLRRSEEEKASARFGPACGRQAG